MPSPPFRAGRTLQGNWKISRPGEKITFQFEDTGAFWKINISHQFTSPYFGLPGYTEEIITTPELLNECQFLFVSLPGSPANSEIICGVIGTPTERVFANIEDVVNYLVDQYA